MADYRSEKQPEAENDDGYDKKVREIIETRKDDERYSPLIEEYEKLSREAMEILNNLSSPDDRDGMAKAFRKGKRAGAIENRLMEIYESEQE